MATTARTNGQRLGCALAAGLLFVSMACGNDGPTAPSGDVPIMAEFDSKIVYGTSRSLDVEALRQHCRRLDGTFNSCGTICAPDAVTCATVCAFTCEQIAP